MPISISVRAISVALLLLANAIAIVAAPLVAAVGQMPSTQDIERRNTKLTINLYALRWLDPSIRERITADAPEQIHPEERISLCLDSVQARMVRDSDDLKTWHFELFRSPKKKEPEMLYLGQVRVANLEQKQLLFGRDVLKYGKNGLFYEDIVTTQEIETGRVVSHESTNLAMERLRRWDAEKRIDLQEAEEFGVKEWDGFHEASKELVPVAGWDLSRFANSYHLHPAGIWLASSTSHVRES
ncbi:hypothetical protein FB446DRAFT_788318 [Lentinula raphanica]|nr:hypothetical protein FB446DRAFT_788318 [Lentinula raphanica]